MKKILFILLIGVVVLLSANIALAYIPEVGPGVCIFRQSNGDRCDESTQYCAEGCPFKPGHGGLNSLFAPGEPGPFIIIVVIFFVIVGAAVSAQKKKRLQQVQLPPAEQPIPGEQAPAPATPAAPAAGTAPANAPINSQSNSKVNLSTPAPAPQTNGSQPKDEKHGRVFRPVYSGKTAPQSGGNKPIRKM